MKTYYKILVLCLLFPLITIANNDKFKGKYTKEKKVTKEFQVNADGSLEIENKFGNVTIATWSENRTVIEVTIKTNGDDQAKVQERLNDISIELNGNRNLVSAKTIIAEKDKSWGWKNNKNVSMEINYIIKMPKSNSLNLMNSYGALNINDLDGNATIICKYGQMYAGNLNAADNHLNLKYVDAATIKFIKSGKLIIAYSDITLEKAENLDLFADYTQTKLGTIKTLKYENRYGKLQVENVKDIIGDAAYNGAVIGTITGKANFDLRYSGISVSQLSPTAKNVSIDGKYSKITLGLHPDYAFNLNVNVSYGSLKGEDLLTLKPQIESSRRSKSYEGYHNKDNSGNIVTINSSYGTVTFNQI